VVLLVRGFAPSSKNVSRKTRSRVRSRANAARSSLSVGRKRCRTTSAQAFAFGQGELQEQTYSEAAISSYLTLNGTRNALYNYAIRAFYPFDSYVDMRANNFVNTTPFFGGLETSVKLSAVVYHIMEKNGVASIKENWRQDIQTSFFSTGPETRIEVGSSTGATGLHNQRQTFNGFDDFYFGSRFQTEVRVRTPGVSLARGIVDGGGDGTTDGLPSRYRNNYAPFGYFTYRVQVNDSASRIASAGCKRVA
jgi:hypothetical protein